ncbi:programmed cell death protein 2-like [Hoplias malabaricus]|uniref:programmed cell death protein 2-like n=1 Tax=Hoplias malabaricus TaxID=27720 RepID=UPI003461B1B5
MISRLWLFFVRCSNPTRTKVVSGCCRTMQESPLVGTCDGPVEKKNSTVYYTNKVGGSPDLIPGVSHVNKQCSLCDGTLSHVVQIYCPLAASSYHRTINVFACTNQQCCGRPQSWKAIRSQVLESEVKQNSEHQDFSVGKEKQEAAMSTTDWCDEADDWGMEAEDNKPENSSQTNINMAPTVEDNFTNGSDVSTRLQGLCLNSPQESGGAVIPTSVSTFQPFYISVVEESDLVGYSDLEHANRLLREYEERERLAVGDIRSCEGGGGEEKYEKTEAKHGDAVFSCFMKKISLCPEQILRYSWSGSPLFIAEPPSDMNKMVPACEHCGSPRVFEFQLMPALVSLLRSTDISSELVLEFGTVLVYTCRDSCWTPGSKVPVEEFLFVQADPDQKLFK